MYAFFELSREESDKLKEIRKEGGCENIVCSGCPLHKICKIKKPEHIVRVLIEYILKNEN